MKKKKTKSRDPFFSYKRKKEILGLLLLALGIMFAVSILTYRSEDLAILKSLDMRSLFDPGQGAALRIQNGLGPLGAWISHFFVQVLLGFPSIVLTGIMIFYGWGIFRHKDLRNRHLKVIYALFVMFLLSSLFGWLFNEFDWLSPSWGGGAGIALAHILRTLTGAWGPVIILGSLMILAVLLLLNKDIQTLIDRSKRVLYMIGSWFSRKEEDFDERISDDEAPADEPVIRDKPEKPGRRARILSEEERQKRWQEIMDRSRDAEKQRADSERQEIKEDDLPRAVLQKWNETSGIEESPWVKETDGEESAEEQESSLEDGLEIKVYKGTPEEEAGRKKLESARRAEAETPLIKYSFPTLDLLDKAPDDAGEVDFEEINQNKMIILDKLNRHGIDIQAIEAVVGPTVTLYELQPAPDVKISKIESYANDLKMAMAARGLRIIAPIPGKSAVGIEVPNKNRETVYIRSLINTRKFVETKMALPVAFGRTIENEVFMVDLARLPHLLMAGATGSGKTVGINTIITCLLYKCHPDNLKFVMIDPKKIELSLYRNIQRHYLATIPQASEPIVTDTSEVLQVLTSVTLEMDNRYELLKMGQVRDISAYNEKFKSGVLEKELGHRHLPYIVVVIDELADLMLTAGKQIEEPIARLAQLARAVGIHLVVATQRPSVNVITGTIKANFPARIAYQVASKIDSRTILDTMGADQLVGRGDMLYNGGGAHMIRLQNAFVSTEEVERINAFIGAQTGYSQPYYLPEPEDNTEKGGIPDKSERDDLFDEAARLLVLHQQGSVSLLQRKLKLGYNRAGRLIDQLFAAGIVGPYQGSTAREVLVESEDELEMILRNLDD